MQENGLSIRVHADDSFLAPMREMLATYLRTHDAHETVISDLLLAVQEVLTNVVRHAYCARGPGLMHLSVDAGRRSGRGPDRGRGPAVRSHHPTGSGSGRATDRRLRGLSRPSAHRPSGLHPGRGAERTHPAPESVGPGPARGLISRITRGARRVLAPDGSGRPHHGGFAPRARSRQRPALIRS